MPKWFPDLTYIDYSLLAGGVVVIAMVLGLLYMAKLRRDKRNARDKD